MKRILLITLVALGIALSAVALMQSIPRDASPSVNLKITGMYCASCVVSVEKALKKVDGVKSVNVNAAKGTARVSITDSALPSLKLIKAVNSVGFNAEYLGTSSR